MKKEEILKASQNENKERDLVAIEIEQKSFKLASLSILFLATVYFCLGIFIKGETNYGWYSIIALYSTILYGYKALKTKRPICIVCSIIWAIVTIILVYSYVKAIILTSTIL